MIAIAALTCYLAVAGGRALIASHDLIPAVAVAQWRTVGPGLVAVVLLLLAAERWWPAVPRPLLARAHLVDAAYCVLFGVVVVPVLTVVEEGFVVELERHARLFLLGRLPFVPQVAVAAGIMVGIDAMNWSTHVANHRSATLWRLHALHHSQEDMSVLTTFRTHPLVHATYLGALLPALALGASGSVPGVVLVVYGCLVALPHANVRWTFGPFGRILVSPAYHRLHHARMDSASGAGVNFGFVLVCWDRLAGCARTPSPGDPMSTGIAGRPVPVEQEESPVGLPRLMVEQLVQPFRFHAMGGNRP